jgi:hypothetical protein
MSKVILWKTKHSAANSFFFMFASDCLKDKILYVLALDYMSTDADNI